MDSLRYWITQMGVTASFRSRHFAGPGAAEVDRWARSSTPSARTPRSAGQAHRGAVWTWRGRLPGRKLPPLWSEWNGKYRDNRARLLAGAERRIGEFAYRSRALRPLRGHGPPPLRQHQLRHRPRRFTLHDLVSYNGKHNEANARTTGTARSDTVPGTWVWKAPPTTLRSSAAGATEAQLPGHPELSQGVPMLVAGDEPRPAPSRGTTTPTPGPTRSPWVDWENADQDLLEFTRG